MVKTYVPRETLDGLHTLVFWDHIQDNPTPVSTSSTGWPLSLGCLDHLTDPTDGILSVGRVGY